MVPEYINKIKKHIESVERNDLYVAALIFLVGLSSFGLGRLSAVWPKKEPITITGNQESPSRAPTAGQAGIRNQGSINRQEASISSSNVMPTAAKGKYVASKNGGSYHLPWCSGAQRIKEENKIWFQTKEEAESRGYKPAGNCEGL